LLDDAVIIQRAQLSFLPLAVWVLIPVPFGQGNNGSFGQVYTGKICWKLHLL